MNETEHVAQIQVTVTVDGMTESAQSRLVSYVQRFADDLTRETERLEAGTRALDLDAREITTTMVVQANEAIRSPSLGSASSGSSIPGHVLVIQTVAFSSGVISGVFGSYLNSTWQWTVFALVLFTALTTQSVSAYMLWRRR